MVLYLFNAYADNEKAFFKREVLDPTRSGAMYKAVSPGNVQYLEALVQMNLRDKDGGVVRGGPPGSGPGTLAELALITFVGLILSDDELFDDVNSSGCSGLLSMYRSWLDFNDFNAPFPF